MSILNFVKTNSKLIVKSVLVGGAVTAVGLGVKALLKKETGLPEGYEEGIAEDIENDVE